MQQCNAALCHSPRLDSTRLDSMCFGQRTLWQLEKVHVIKVGSEMVQVSHSLVGLIKVSATKVRQLRSIPLHDMTSNRQI